MKSKTEVYTFKNEGLETELSQEHALLMSRSKALAKEHALLNQPQVNANPKPYLGEIEHSYETLGHKVRTTLQPEVHQKDLDEKDLIFEEKIQYCNKELSQLENEIRLKKNEVDQTDSTLLQKLKRWKYFRIGIFAIVLCDILISSTAIQQMKYTLIESLMLGGTIGFCILLLSEHLKRIIQIGRTKLARKVIAISIFSFMFMVFLVLGHFRSQGIESDHFSASPLYFALIQMFFLIVSSLVAYINKPSVSEYKQIDIFKTQLGQLNQLDAKQSKIQLEKSQTQLKQKEIIATKERLIQYYNDLLIEINGNWKKAYQAYCSINMFARSDNQIPHFFNKSIYNLSFISKTK